jgi:hypothetical protein
MTDSRADSSTDPKCQKIPQVDFFFLAGSQIMIAQVFVTPPILGDFFPIEEE